MRVFLQSRLFNTERYRPYLFVEYEEGAKCQCDKCYLNTPEMRRYCNLTKCEDLESPDGKSYFVAPVPFAFPIGSVFDLGLESYMCVERALGEGCDMCSLYGTAFCDVLGCTPHKRGDGKYVYYALITK